MLKLSQKLANLPHNPGVYIFKNAAGKILYIGKAKDLKKRVRSYFQKTPKVESKTKQLIDRVKDLDFIITDSEVEALLLEAKLIKENQPKYNIDLKGGIRYAYIRITDEPFPRLETARIIKRSDKVFGPYALAGTRKNLIQLANTLFKLRSGKGKPIKAGDKYKIRCSVPPWTRIITKEEYQKDIADALLFLKGQTKELIKKLENEMAQYSASEQYELAKIRRDQVQALRNLAQAQKVQLKKSYDQDVVAGIIVANKFVVQLFNINKGVISGRKEFKFSNPTKQEVNDLLFEFLKQYYYSNELPQEIIISEKIKDQKLLARYLTKLAGRSVRLAVPQKGNNLKLIELLKKNIVAGLKRGDAALLELQNRLSLPKLPLIIECFDISNLGESQIVGSMVYFKDGVADKNNYRKFKVKWQRGQSDFDAMQEVVYRRYARLKREQAQFPDLVLIDGGKPQLSAARTSLRQLGLSLPVAALAKKEEELFLPGKKFSIRLSKKSDALKLVQKIRDEAHRFAIEYHRLLRKKKLAI